MIGKSVLGAGVVSALALGLAACSGEAPAPDTSEAGPTETVQEGTAATVIPEMLRGRWGLVPADCTSDRGDAKGLLTVSEDELEFYESVAEMGMIKQVTDSSVAASFQFSGEGQNWILDVSLMSPDGGETMVREDTGPDAAPEPLTYTKCPE